MKKFVIKSILFVLPLLAAGIAMEFLIRNIPNDYSYKKSFLDTNSNKIEVLFMGSSHAYYGIDPKFVKANAFNASHVSQTLDYDFELLKIYQGKWNQLRCIVVPIDYFTLFISLSNSAESWRMKNYEIYYGIDKSNELRDNSELLSVRPILNLKRVYSYYFRQKSSITCSELGYGKKGSKKDLLQTGISAAKRHTVSNKLLFEKNKKILQELVEFTSKENIKIIFYTAPGYHTYVSNLNSKQLRLTVETMNDFVRLNSNCLYYNFLNDTSFNANDFNDADHLNDNGAKKLSIKLDDIINSR